MSAIVFILLGILIGASLIGSYLMGREHGRLKAIDEVARTMGGRIIDGGRVEEPREAEMTVVRETETNPDGRPRQEIIAELSAGDSVNLVRERSDANEPNAVRVVSRLGDIGRLARTDANNVAPYLDGGGRVRASIALISASSSTNAVLNVVLSVVALT